MTLAAQVLIRAPTVVGASRLRVKPISIIKIETFNFNFNVNLKLFLSLFNCASVGEKTLIIIKMHGMYVKKKFYSVTINSKDRNSFVSCSSDAHTKAGVLLFTNR